MWRPHQRIELAGRRVRRIFPDRHDGAKLGRTSIVGAEFKGVTSEADPPIDDAPPWIPARLANSPKFAVGQEG